MATCHVHGFEVEYRLEQAAENARAHPALVFLHEGLGSAGMWRDVPDAVREELGGPTILVYSRPGYGRSTVVAPSRPATFLRDEALGVLPVLLEELDIHRPVLIGHSDGASIALEHAGAGHPVSGLVVMAPHVFVEDISLEGVAAAKEAYLSGGLRQRLQRHHDDVDAMFWGWAGTWLSPEFRDWSIEDALSTITCPVLAIQGADDEYGTLAQLDAIEAAVPGGVERLVLAGCGHVPHVERRDEVLGAITRFIRAIAKVGPDRDAGHRPTRT
jgi:pimeloyl-ACP methyl ester carboxylesterase